MRLPLLDAGSDTHGISRGSGASRARMRSRLAPGSIGDEQDDRLAVLRQAASGVADGWGNNIRVGRPVRR